MRRLTKFITTALLSLTAIGIFSSRVSDKSSDSFNLVNKTYNGASAAVADPEPIYPNDIYFAFNTKWHHQNGSLKSNFYVRFRIKESTTGTNHPIDSTYIDTTVNRGGTDWVIYKISRDNSSQNQINFNIDNDPDAGYVSRSRTTGDIDIPKSIDGKINFCVVNSERTGVLYQKAFWTTFQKDSKDWGSNVKTDTLYFSPNYNWYHNADSGSNCWPTLTMTFSDSSSIDRPAFCVTASSIQSTFASSNDKQYVFYFENIPCNKTVSSMKIYHSPSKADGCLDCSSYVTNWYDPTSGSHRYNVIGTDSGSDWNNNYPIFWYVNLESKAFLSASFSENGNLANRGTSPTIHNSFQKISTGVYTISSDVNLYDRFLLYTYENLLNNATTSGTQSFVQFYNLGFFDYSIEDYTIIDRGITVDNPTDYITYAIEGSGDDEKDWTQFIRGGSVEFRRTTSDPLDGGIQISYFGDSRFPSGLISSEPIGASYVSGTFNNNLKTINPLQYNYNTGRFETIVAVFANDSFKYEGDSKTAIVSASTVDTNEGFTISDGDDNDLVISVIGFYAIGWYPYNDNPTGLASREVEYFVYKIEPSTSINAYDCGVALGKRSSIYEQICDTTNHDYSTEAGHLKTLHDSFGESPAILTARDNGMESFTFLDYDYSLYVINNRSYTNLEKVTQTDGLTKYEWIQYKHNGGPLPTRGLGSITENDTYKENSTIIVIVIASTSLLAIASLAAVNFLAIKKRKQK